MADDAEAQGFCNHAALHVRPYAVTFVQDLVFCEYLFEQLADGYALLDGHPFLRAGESDAHGFFGGPFPG